MSYENENTRKRTKKIWSTSRILNNFYQTWVWKSTRIKVHNAPAFPILLYGSEIWTHIKKKTMIDINRDENFPKNNRLHTFWPQKKWRVELFKVESVEEELRRSKIQLVTTYNKNEQQQNAQNNAEL
jgi:hypothetical protein